MACTLVTFGHLLWKNSITWSCLHELIFLITFLVYLTDLVHSNKLENKSCSLIKSPGIYE